jgi:LysR family transcriptional regulator, transcriptional activator of nhaA
MNRLNYHHLLYFWAVAKEGSLRRAAEKLHISQPTISAQIRQLEESLGEVLFSRSARSLTLTEPGQVVFGYAEDIFELGRELVTTLGQEPSERPLRLQVGIFSLIPSRRCWHAKSCYRSFVCRGRFAWSVAREIFAIW